MHEGGVDGRHPAPVHEGGVDGRHPAPVHEGGVGGRHPAPVHEGGTVGGTHCDPAHNGAGGGTHAEPAHNVGRGDGIGCLSLISRGARDGGRGAAITDEFKDGIGVSKTISGGGTSGVETEPDKGVGFLNSIRLPQRPRIRFVPSVNIRSP